MTNRLLNNFAFVALFCGIAPIVAYSQTSGVSHISAPAQLKPGDTLSIVVYGEGSYSGDFTVLSDGSINGHGFGRIVVEGKTTNQVRNMIIGALVKSLKNPLVSVLLRSQRQDIVYVSGADSEHGTIPLIPGATLRQVVASVKLPADLDLLEVELYRSKGTDDIWNVSDVLRGGSDSGNTKLRPNDVLILRPLEYLRVWVTGRSSSLVMKESKRERMFIRLLLKRAGSTLS